MKSLRLGSIKLLTKHSNSHTGLMVQQKLVKLLFVLQDGPFFLLMSYDEVHVPLLASRKFLGSVSQLSYSYIKLPHGMPGREASVSGGHHIGG